MRSIILTGASGFIGTNYVDFLARRPDVRLLNLDIAPPKKREHERYWVRCDILDRAALSSIVQQEQPTELVHLAARTDMEGKTIADYVVNTVGTENIALAVKSCPAIRRAIFTSTQYVVGPGALPAHDLDFRPHTVYGQSKVISEQVVRAAGMTCCWTIVRPTNIWGSWHPRYPNEFWKVLKSGRYFHPGKQPVIRSYGYVRTVISQIEKILGSPGEMVEGKVFYLGDPSINLLDWVNAFSRELTGHNARIVPRWILRMAALAGDGIIACGMNFPLFSSRYHSMTENYDTPMQATFDALGTPQCTLQDSVRETVGWLQSQSEFWR